MISPSDATLILPPDTPRLDWLAARRQGLGGSDAPTLIGFNTLSSGFELWLDKTGRIPLVDEQSEDAEMGALLEPVVRDRFARKTGLAIEPAGMWRSVRWPWMLANPDGLCNDGYGYEGKTCTVFKAHEWDNGQVADRAELQAQWCMAVTGLPGWHVACLIGGQRNVYRTVERDDELIEHLVDISGRWWRTHVEADIEPSADGSTACTDILAKRYPTAIKDLEVEIDGDAADELAAAKAAALEAEKAATKAHEAVKNRARQLLGKAEFLVSGGRTIAAWSPIEALSMKRLEAERPELVAEYTRPVKEEKFDVEAFRAEQPEVWAEFRRRRLTFNS